MKFSLSMNLMNVKYLQSFQEYENGDAIAEEQEPTEMNNVVVNGM